MSALESWGKDEAKEYSSENCAPDIDALLAPRLSKLLPESLLQDAHVIDVGTGVGVWAELAHRKGAKSVVATDGSHEMVEAATERLKGGGTLPDGLSVEHAEVTNMPFQDGEFDIATSVNVACNLDSKELEAHFIELDRILKPGGRLILAVPNSLDVAFTRGDRSVDIQEELSRAIDGRTGDVREVLRGVRFLLQSTFFADREPPTLVTPSNSGFLSDGDPIIRSFSGFGVINNWHTKNGYLQAIIRRNWYVLDIYEDSFPTEEALYSYNQSVIPDRRLGPEYVRNAPFLVFNVSKR